jgi:predicted NBD/HSP70 family sugar kinase
MDASTTHYLAALGVYIAGQALTIAVLKRDSTWIRRWQLKHEKDDERRFQSVERDIRELRQDLRMER